MSNLAEFLRRNKKRLIGEQPKLPSETGDAVSCHDCGGCCSYYANIGLTPQDGIPSAFTAILRRDGEPDSLVMKLTDAGRCPFWAGVVGETSKCTIHNSRPAVCRDYPVGSNACLKVRKKFEIEKLHKRGVGTRKKGIWTPENYALNGYTIEKNGK